MTALDQQYLRRRELEDALCRVRVTATGMPGRMPVCPKCEENEMVARQVCVATRNRFTCGACGYWFECPAPDAPAPKTAEPPAIGATLDALFSEHSAVERVRGLYGVYRKLVSETLRACVDLGALPGELRFATALSTLARGVERIGVRHIRIVLARKDPGHG